MAEPINWTEIQSALLADGFYTGKLDGDPGNLTWKAVNAALAREELAADWEDWSAARKKIAVEQAIMHKAGIDTGTIDGLTGPQTAFAREAYRHLRETGHPLVQPERDTSPEPPPAAPASASIWPRQPDCRAFYGEPGTNQTMLQLPYQMKLAWETATTIRRFSCHEKVHDAFLRVFQKILAEYGEARIRELRLDLFGGCLNVRKMKGGNQMSMHSWGIAVDLDPGHNSLKMTSANATLALPAYAPFWRIVEGEGLLSLGRTRNFDWMHFQAARL